MDEKTRPKPSMREKLKAKTDKWIDMFSTLVTRRPWKVLCLTAVTFVVCMVLLFAVGFTQTQNSQYEWELPFHKFTERRDMLDEAADDVDGALLPTRSDPTYGFTFYYDADPNNYANKCEGPLGVFSPVNIQKMCEAEREMWGRRDWLTKFCYLADGDAECVTPEDSVVTLAYDQRGVPLVNASYYTGNCPLLSDAEVTDRWEQLLRGLRTTDDFSFYFDEEVLRRGYPCKARGLIDIGTPLDGKDDVSRWDDKQFRKIDKQFASKVDDDLKKRYNMKRRGSYSAYNERARAGEAGRKMDVLWTSSFSENWQFMEALDNDFMLAIASVLFVWLWLMVHTESKLIGSVSMLQIIISLPFSIFFYRVILQIRYFSIMQQLVIFVILGIGADDVFVYTDAWKQSKDIFLSHDDDTGGDLFLKKRVAYAYARAAQAIFNTSFTTAVAFFATAISELVPIHTFGIFAALCVIMNFALVLTVTPAIVVIHHRNFVEPKRRAAVEGDVELSSSSSSATKKIGEEKGGEREDVVEEAPPPEENQQTKKRCPVGNCCKSSCCDVEAWIRGYVRFLSFEFSSSKKGVEARVQDEEDGHETTQRCANKRPMAWLLVLLFATYGALMSYFASRLTPPSQVEVWFPSPHMATRIDKLNDGKFGSNDDTYYPIISVVWGMDRIRRGDFDIYVPHENRGDVSYSNKPRLYQDSAQDQVLRACEGLRTFVCKSGCAGETLSRPNTTICFLEEFQSWHADQGFGSTYGLAQDVFDDRLMTFRDTTVPRGGASSTASSWKELIGFVDGELRYVRLDARLGLDVEGPIDRKTQVLRRVNSLMTRYARNLDTELPSVWQTSEAWIWFIAQKKLVEGLLQGMAIAFPVALLVLCGATGNAILALFAITAIGCIVSSVLGLTYLLGWYLGVKEAIAGVVVIGLAVDYTLHLGHMYDADEKHGDSSNVRSREEKVTSAMLTMGPTVFNGAITTAGSAMFLLFAELTFFSQMAILILATIISSLIYSIFFFIPLLFVLGPEGDTGNIKAIQHSIERRFCRRCYGDAS